MNLLNNIYFRYFLFMVVGFFMCLIFNFSYMKTSEEKISKLVEQNSKINEINETYAKDIQNLNTTISSKDAEFKSFKKDTEVRITELRSENFRLKQSQKKKKFKIVKPDGTIIEKEYEESSSEQVSSIVSSIKTEFNEKISLIENRWKQAYSERVVEIKKEYEQKLQTEKENNSKLIEKTQKTEKISTNEKKIRLELGYSHEDAVYTHISYPILGSIFIGGGTSLNYDNKGYEFRAGMGIEL